jgi:hypothetical protein
VREGLALFEVILDVFEDHVPVPAQMGFEPDLDDVRNDLPDLAHLGLLDRAVIDNVLGEDALPAGVLVIVLAVAVFEHDPQVQGLVDGIEACLNLVAYSSAGLGLVGERNRVDGREIHGLFEVPLLGVFLEGCEILRAWFDREVDLDPVEAYPDVPEELDKLLGDLDFLAVELVHVLYDDVLHSFKLLVQLCKDVFWHWHHFIEDIAKGI